MSEREGGAVAKTKARSHCCHIASDRVQLDLIDKTVVSATTSQLVAHLLARADRRQILVKDGRRRPRNAPITLHFESGPGQAAGSKPIE